MTYKDIRYLVTNTVYDDDKNDHFFKTSFYTLNDANKNFIKKANCILTALKLLTAFTM